MNPIAEAKKLGRKRWVLLVVGILLGGTVLAGIVAMVMGKFKGIVSKVTGGGASAEKVLSNVGPTK